MGSVPVLICEHCGSEIAASPFGRFWSKVDKNGPIPEHHPDLGPCWLWTTGLYTSGYGQFHMYGLNRRAHMVAWEWANGQIPEGLYVCHACDTRACVRPDHLFLDTPKGNIQDAVRKGRMSHGPQHWLRTRPDRRRHAKGSDNGTAKLTEDDVREIRRLAAEGVPQKDIAIMYGMSQSSICQIVKRNSWKHVL